MVLLGRLFITLACALGAHGSPPKRLVCETTVQSGDGILEIELWPAVAPHGVQRAVELVEDGFFNDLPFFRAIQGFLIQFGISVPWSICPEPTAVPSLPQCRIYRRVLTS